SLLQGTSPTNKRSSLGASPSNKRSWKGELLGALSPRSPAGSTPCSTPQPQNQQPPRELPTSWADDVLKSHAKAMENQAFVWRFKVLVGRDHATKLLHGMEQLIATLGVSSYDRSTLKALTVMTTGELTRASAATLQAMEETMEDKWDHALETSWEEALNR
ncbi:unnamed protein product, partial [Chrysoparadoxa australica]